MTTQPDQIPARRMGHFVRTPEFHRTIPLLILGPNLPNAACKNKGNLWDITVDGETDEARAQRINTAIGICGTCPTAQRCLDARLANPQLGEGVYGGQLFGKPAQRLCACGCGQPLPPDAHTQRRYHNHKCRQRAYLANPETKTADLKRRAARDRARNARRKTAAA
jgi:hypothetical protein